MKANYGPEYYTPDNKDCNLEFETPIEILDVVPVIEGAYNPYDIIYTKSHSEIWKDTINEIPRIISHGDASIDLSDDIICILPFWKNPDTGITNQLVLVTGKVIDIIYQDVTNNKFPRFTKYESSQDIYLEKPWVDKLAYDLMKYMPSKYTQTAVTIYEIKLHEKYYITKSEYDEIRKLYPELEPCNEELVTHIKVSRRYVLGNVQDCVIVYCNRKFVKSRDVDIEDIKKFITHKNIFPGLHVTYLDEGCFDNTQVNMLIKDHVCAGPLDVKYIVEVFSPVGKIIDITKATNWDVFGAYNVEKYHIYHPSDTHKIELVQKSQYDKVDDIRVVLYELFSKMGIYIVKKPLVKADNADRLVYMNPQGEKQLLDIASSKFSVRKNFIFTQMVMSEYVSGTAYPEGNDPKIPGNYKFFHSKDYSEYNFNLESEHFCEIVNNNEDHEYYRHPIPGEIIMAGEFICNRGPWSGKINLKWFYPDKGFIALHRYICTGGSHSNFRNMSLGDVKKMMYIKDKMYYIDIINLFYYGLTENNPTLYSSFTQAFATKFFWWRDKEA